MTTTNDAQDHDTQYEAAPYDEADGPYWSATRVALAVVVILIVAMWVWIYLWAPRDNPDRIETRAFAENAQALCEPLQSDIAAIPPSSTDTTIAEKAERVAAGTRLTVQMVDGLKAQARTVTNEGDIRLLDLWLGDWDAYIADRDAYYDRLATADADADRADLAFTLTERSSGGSYTTTIDGFATVNDMDGCVVPRDI